MSTVLYEKKGRIAYITLNRPDKLNAISPEAATELGKIWLDLRDDDNLWVAVLSGAGKSFCAGADLGGITTKSWKLATSATFGDRPTSPSAHRMWKPIVVALQGHVLGAGFWLALESDIRIAATNALFGLPEPKMGMATIFSALVPRHIPVAIANELLLLRWQDGFLCITRLVQQSGAAVSSLFRGLRFLLKLCVSPRTTSWTTHYV